MKLLDFRWLSGCNRYGPSSLVIGNVEVSASERADLDKLAPSLRDGLTRLYPEISWPAIVGDEPPDEATISATLSAFTAALANLIDDRSTPLPAFAESEQDRFSFGATCYDPKIGPRLSLAFDIVNACAIDLLADRPIQIKHAKAYARFGEKVELNTLGIDARAILHVAELRGMPWSRVRLGQGIPIFQIGWGCKSKRFNGTRGPATSFWACTLSHDKQATTRALARVGLPAPRQKVVFNERQAISAASDIGLPVVVKPLQGHFGKGITVGLDYLDDVARAYRRAREFHRRIIVESYLPGDDYRFLVINGRVAAVARRLPAGVVGDGRSSIAELVSEANRDKRRTATRHSLLRLIEIDDDSRLMLDKQHLTLSDIPAEGRFVRLKSTSNRHTGGTSQDVTDQAHPDNLLAAERAAAALGLDIAGIDFLSPDITRSWIEVGGGICEVNDQPGLAVHTIAETDNPRDFGAVVLDAMFPAGSTGRIPVIAVTGPTASDLVHQISSELRSRGILASCLDDEGLWISASLIKPASDNFADDALAALEDPSAEVAVFALPEAALKASGLGFDRVSVMVLDTIAALSDETRKPYRSLGDTTVLLEPGKITAIKSDSSDVIDCAARDQANVLAEFCVSQALTELSAAAP